MTDKKPELEKLIGPDLLPHSEPSPPRPPARDPLLDLLAAGPPEMLGQLAAGPSDAPNYPSDVFTSAEPPAIFRPGNTGIMSPDSTFPGIAPPNIPIPPQNPPQAKPPPPSTGELPAFVPPPIPGTDESTAAPLSSLPSLNPASFSTQPFLPPPDESLAPVAALAAASNPPSPPPGDFIPNPVRDILPLLPNAASNSSADGAAQWRQNPGTGADPLRSDTDTASGSTSKLEDLAARRWPELTVSLGEGHVIEKRVVGAKTQKIEEIARELCKSEIHRSFGAFRADMRANFR